MSTHMKESDYTVEEMLASLPRNERVIVVRLRTLIKECLPAVVEKVYYGEGLPFYTRHRLICFLWPASVYWGKKKEKINKDKLVTLGFCQGNLMSNEDGLLLAEGRKQVYCVYLNSVEDINEERIRAWLYEAELIDEEFGRKKSAKKLKR